MSFIHAAPGLLTGTLIDLGGNSHVIHWGVLQITVANLIVVGLMVATFVAAIAIPMRRHRKDE